MGLTEYRKKRSFDKTPEPAGDQHSTSEPLRFVIQKHHASRLHYDFRLEMEGVLKSWAVPKGPSLNPQDKRLAMMVEDHPYDYRAFEGIIPQGNYGAGTVIIWDEGTYEPLEPVSKNKKEQEKQLLQALHKGDLKINMKGKKIKGAYALVRTKRNDEENAWLLIKKKDRHASETDITQKDKSVVSGKTLEKVAATSTNEWVSNRSSDGKIKNDKKTTPATKRSSEKKIKQVKPEVGIKERFPEGIKPMLATLTDESFDDDKWIFEVKWDGYRALSFLRKGNVELLSRNNISFIKKFHPVAAALSGLDVDAVIDGEIIAMNEKGNSDFQLLQSWQKTGKGKLVYYAFDLLWLNGYSLTGLPLIERKEILKSIIPDDSIIKYSDHITGTGNEFYKLAVKEGLEGIIAKYAESTYHPGVRTKQWLKIKSTRRQEVVIAGFTKGRGGRKHFGALVLGIYENKKFIYAGHTGSGFDSKSLSDIYEKLEPLITDEMPFEKKPKTNMPVIWVKPELVCEVKFQEWTRDNAMRHPIFMGLREDKNAVSVKKENAVPLEKVVDTDEKDVENKKTAKKSAPPGKTVKKTGEKKPTPKFGLKTDNPFTTEEKQIDLNLNKHKITLTNLDKLYWKKEKITKGSMLGYYYRIMDYILPYMINRPQSLNRFPDGADGKNFYQKNVEGKVAPWIKKHDYVSESDNETKKFLVCADEATLMYMANLGCIEMNPWHSRISTPDNPDWCVIDLDPGNIGFDKVIEAAQVVKQVVDALDLPSWAKTSGSTGIHIYIPLGALYTYEQSKQLAELIVTFVHDQIPAFTSLERSPAKRKTKIYLDYLQNRAIQTIAAPYSLRPKPGATVSAPLHWEEVKKGLKMAEFTMFTIFDRLKTEGDLFSGVLGKGIDLGKALEKASLLLK